MWITKLAIVAVPLLLLFSSLCLVLEADPPRDTLPTTPCLLLLTAEYLHGFAHLPLIWGITQVSIHDGSQFLIHSNLPITPLTMILLCFLSSNTEPRLPSQLITFQATMPPSSPFKQDALAGR